MPLEKRLIVRYRVSIAIFEIMKLYLIYYGLQEKLVYDREKVIKLLIKKTDTYLEKF